MSEGRKFKLDDDHRLSLYTLMHQWSRNTDLQFNQVVAWIEEVMQHTLAEAALRAETPPHELLEAAKVARDEMCRTVAPRDSFTDAVDRLDAAIGQARAETREREVQLYIPCTFHKVDEDGLWIVHIAEPVEISLWEGCKPQLRFAPEKLGRVELTMHAAGEPEQAK